MVFSGQRTIKVTKLCTLSQTYLFTPKIKTLVVAKNLRRHGPDFQFVTLTTWPQFLTNSAFWITSRRKHKKIWASAPALLIQHFNSITRQWTLSWKLETIITWLLWQTEEITETVFTFIFRAFSSSSEKAETSRGWFRSIDLWVMGPARFRCATLLWLFNFKFLYSL